MAQMFKEYKYILKEVTGNISAVPQLMLFFRILESQLK